MQHLEIYPATRILLPDQPDCDWLACLLEEAIGLESIRVAREYWNNAEGALRLARLITGLQRIQEYGVRDDSQASTLLAASDR